MYFLQGPSHWNRAGRVITESGSESESILGRVGVGVGVIKHWLQHSQVRFNICLSIKTTLSWMVAIEINSN